MGCLECGKAFSPLIGMVSDSENPREPINGIHRFLTMFVRWHLASSRESFPDWSNLFSLVATACDKALKEKIEAFVKMWF